MRRSILSFIPAAGVVVAALVAPSTAMAWEHTLTVWLPEDMPLRYWVADDGEDGVLCVDDPTTDIDERIQNPDGSERRNCCEESVPGGYCTTVSAEGYDGWKAAECAEYSVEYQGVRENNGFIPNNTNTINFNDPREELELGVLAAAVTIPLGQAFVFDGQVYGHAIDADIVFNDNVQFDTYESIAGGTCNGGHDMRGVMTHEIGHTLGMGHSCEEEDTCTDPLLRDATMFWSVDACNITQSDVNQDDIEGFTALYGPSASFECSHEVTSDLAVGIVPFEMNCVLVSDFLNEITDASWNFGDGGTATDLTPTHTYTEAGNYTIQLSVDGERDACGEDGWSNNFRRVGYVRACDVPEVEFEAEPNGGLAYQFLNNSDISVYGCIQDIEWLVYAGTSTDGDTIVPPIKAWEPVVEFPEPGQYTVVTHIGGFAGTGSATLTFDVSRTANNGGCGCNAGASGVGLGGVLLLGLIGLVRRRS